MMARDGKIRELEMLGLFAGCTNRELRSAAQLCTSLDVAEGSVLTTQGGRGEECFVIAAGNAVVAIDGRTVATVGPGDCVGEMSLLDGGPRTATVTALTPMTLYVLSSVEFRSLLDTTSVARKIMTSLTRRFRDAGVHRPGDAPASFPATFERVG
jgi:CRP-like cAMP-binding protein